MQWEVVIGLEIHAQLATKTKIFSGSPTAYGALPNTQANSVDLAMPGMLPVLNKEAVRMAVKFGLALNAQINQKNVFARKNYFYPDLPQGYQISQYDLPIVGLGHLDIELEDGTTKRIGVTRAHLEQDAGKSLHEDFAGMTGIDLNRSGTPLLEIVSEPDLRSAKEAVAYAKKIHALVQYLEICDGNMQEGSFRMDANISIHQPGTPFGTRAEIKNVNSFRFLERAINFEVERQMDVIESGGTVVQETRLYDADKDETRSMRAKEEANDYRYFPDPDLLPVWIEQGFIDAVRETLPELPDAKRARYIDELGLKPYDAQVITASKDVADFFEAVLTASGHQAKLAANWVMGDFSAQLNREGIAWADSPVSAEVLGQIIRRQADDTLSGKGAKDVFFALWKGEGTEVDAVIESKGLKQVTDEAAIEALVDQVLAAHPAQVEQYKGGNDKLMGFFVGQIMKASKGAANPGVVNALIQQKLG
jgi:aspartyl-tRNA(Asn)/glutamyl-tRNA(Gln) amidotransferase subunit B